jgi:ATP-binding cassette, subfamily B, bacterial HlyB/CyaB
METVIKNTGLQCLALLWRFHQISVDSAHIVQFSGASIEVPEMLRCAKDLTLKARAVTESWAGLMEASAAGDRRATKAAANNRTSPQGF